MSSKFFQQKIISTTVISNNGSISDHPDHSNIKNMQWYKKHCSKHGSTILFNSLKNKSQNEESYSD